MHGEGSVFIPNQGWHIFGGQGKRPIYAQKLTGLDESWQKGDPEVYLSHSDNYKCIVQVSGKIKSLLSFNLE